MQNRDILQVFCETECEEKENELVIAKRSRFVGGMSAWIKGSTRIRWESKKARKP